MKKGFYLFITIALFSCSAESDEQKKEDAVLKKDSIAAPATPSSTTAKTTDLRYKAGDDLFVLSVSGLNLRQTPEENGTKILTIPYGSKVKILGEKLGEMAFQTEECKGFPFKGYWVKVNFNGKEGFLFDGYLSHLTAPQLNQGDYISGYLGKKAKLTGEKNTKPKDLENVFEYHLYDYSDGTTYELVAAEGGASHTVSFPENLITVEEAFLLGTAFESKNLAKKPCIYDAKENTLMRSADMSEVTVKKEKGRVMLKIGIAD